MMAWYRTGKKSLPEPAITQFNDAFNSSPPGQNGRHFVDDILRCTFVNEKFDILIKVPLKFVPTCPIDNIPALI